ncbi:uncharacterized protein LOC101457133 [Ceratitis capitata]|uniref:uncharacterized protein LOC101457133 n=1 Tax=Ceratitis capitata TaxID=7213 RepID=UPI000329A963|nr:uncharacterized protein LOC101457133 [Ceratitis capitata]XP_004526374.1 uncharacterized protein LOC101457133 [Ceratitis capitata]XP_004526375.1 uncharacterized protein LOC101457133 [Ceratitis capitata]XP_012157744.1 uncharacterized protein LOC101457133 [Ceratitis capitata]
MISNKVWRALSIVGFIGVVISSCRLAEAKVAHKIHCTEDQMQVEIQIPETTKDNPGNKSQIYLEGLKDYPNERCQPEISDQQAVFRLSLTDFYECGVTRMVNQLTGKKVYYHKILIESSESKEVVSVKCITTEPFYNVLMMNATKREHHAVVRRDVLPAGFQEPEDLEITTSLTERAPEPRLSIGVNQNGKKVTGDLTVTPGTPLTMEINLDPDSASVYGLGVNYLEVTDTRQLSETIVFKGCTVDPYLFENFNTIDGDRLSAKFKAFKFPDSSYVQFRATVNVCLDKCLGTQCSNGQIGYGRRRRDTSDILTQGLMDTNKVYEISLAMFIKINDIEGVNRNEVLQLEEKLRELKLANQRLARNSRVHFGETLKSFEQPLTSVTAFVVDEKELSQAQRSASRAVSNRSLGWLSVVIGVYAVVCKFI